MVYAYSPDALVYDADTNNWSLRADYDHTQHRVEIDFNDDDDYLDGDYTEGEVGDDANQSGTVTDMDGNQIASGQIYDEFYYKLESPAGEISYIDVIEIDGVVVGYIVTAPLEPGVTYDVIYSGNVHTYDDDNDKGDTRLHYSSLQSVPCFCQGTTLMTNEGEQPVDWIRPGDRIMTRDHGFQRALWVGRTVISASKLKSTPNLRPVRIAAHSINAQTPTHDLLLSPEHRILLKSHQIELLFGIDEALAPIKALENGADVAQTLPDHEVSYYHVLFENHEIVLAEGLWVESFFPGKMALAAMPAKNQAQIRDLLGANTDTMQTARLCLKPWEVNMLVPQNTAQIIPYLSVA